MAEPKGNGNPPQPGDSRKMTGGKGSDADKPVTRQEFCGCVCGCFRSSDFGLSQSGAEIYAKKQETHQSPYLQGFNAFQEAATAGAGEGNRTLATSLEGWGSTIELHPPSKNHYTSYMIRFSRQKYTFVGVG